jgi:hypothetical protein
LLLLLTAALPGCGYSLGYIAPPDVQTVAVPIFHNATFPLRRDVEYKLTSAVRKEILERTTLRLVDSDEAHMVLRGRIVEFRELLVVEGDRDVKVESSVFAAVDLSLEDQVNKFRVQLPRVTTTEPFSARASDSFESSTGNVVERLAERIVAAMEYWDDYDDVALDDADVAADDF